MHRPIQAGMEPVRERETPDITAGGPAESDSRQVILYPIFSSHNSRTFEIVLDIAEGIDGRVLVLDFVEDELSAVDESRTVGRELLRVHLDEDHDVDVTVHLSESDRPLKTVVDHAQLDAVRLVVFDDHTPEPRLETLRGDVPERVSTKASCDVISITNSQDTRQISSILVPIGEGEHATLAVIVAGALGIGADAVVELFHVSPERDGGESTARDLITTAQDRLPPSVDVDTWHVSDDDVTDAIVEQSSHYDVTVLGKPRQKILPQFVTSSITDEVTEQSMNTVITAKRSEGPMFSFEL